MTALICINTQNGELTRYEGRRRTHQTARFNAPLCASADFLSAIEQTRIDPDGMGFTKLPIELKTRL